MMSRDEVFAELHRRGVAKATANFSGGNDEGFVDEITMFSALGQEVGTLSEYRYGGQGDEDTRLAEAIAQPIYDEYGGFGFEGSVHGDLTWDVPARKVRMSKNEMTEYVHSTVEV